MHDQQVNIRKGVIALVEKDREILMGKKRDIPGHWLSGQWHFPGGKAELKEKPFDTLIREMREELTVDLEIVDLICVQEYQWEDKLIVNSIYHCKTNNIPKAADDLVEVGFFNLEQIQRLHEKNSFERLPTEVHNFLTSFFAVY